ncbi:MAG: DUF1834 family protein [Gallionella sp.]
MIAATEDAMIAHIKGAASATPGLGYKLKQVTSYGGELDDGLDKVIRSFPSVWVTYNGGGKPRAISTQKNKWIMPATFSVMVGSRNVRGERATRQGSQTPGALKEVGAYQILADISLLLAGQDFGLSIKRLQPGAIKTLYNTKLRGQGLAVFAREFHTEYVELQREPIDLSDPMWLRMGLNYYLSPNDDTPDSADELTLNKTLAVRGDNQ